MHQFTIVGDLDAERWDAFVGEHPRGSVFHTSAMQAVFGAAGRHEPLALAAVGRAGDVLAALAAVRVQTLPDPLAGVSSRSIFYAEPLCRPGPDGAEALAALLEEHDRAMGRRTLFAEVRPLAAPAEERDALVQCGYAYEDYLNYIGDLRRPLDEIWAGMSRQCRGNIRHGQREGVTVAEATDSAGVETLYTLLRTTYERVGVPLADKSLFTAALRILQPLDMLKIFVTAHEGVPIGADALLLHKGVIFDWYRGLERVKSLYPGECMVWHQLEWGHQHGFELYDFAGAGRPDTPYGVREFKAKFGGRQVCYGRYRKVYSPLRLALAERAYELKRSIEAPH